MRSAVKDKNGFCMIDYRVRGQRVRGDYLNIEMQGKACLSVRKRYFTTFLCVHLADEGWICYNWKYEKLFGD